MVITKEQKFFKKSGKYFIKYLRKPPEEIKDYFDTEKDYLTQRIYSDATVLEVGCGSGRIMKILADICRHATGIDSSPHLLNMAKKNLKNTSNTTIHLMNAEELDKINERFDIITLMDNTFGNITGREKQLNLLEKLKALLNENGRIIISAYSENAKKAQENSYKRVGLTGIKHEGNYTYTNQGLTSERFTKESLESLLKEANLEAEIQELTPISYICEAKIISAAQ